jgi:subtilisin
VLEFGDVGQAVAGRFSEKAIEALERNPNVRYVEVDGEMQAIGIDAGDTEVPWGVDRVDAEKTHADGATFDVTVTVTDTAGNGTAETRTVTG